jgi:hypothetical protein
MTSVSQHWDSIFAKQSDTTLGWYEKNPTKTLGLLHQIENWQEATVFLSGVGTSTLVDVLADDAITLVLNDISAEALKTIKNRLGDKLNGSVWLCQDIALPIQTVIPPIDIWIDRAVLHFLTDEKSIQGYFDNLKMHLKQGGYAIFAEFSHTGAEKCASLSVHQYSVEELSMRLGTSFKCVKHFDHTYINPHGDDRPYCYALFQCIK